MLRLCWMTYVMWLGTGPVVHSGGYGNGPSFSLQDGGFFDQISDYEPLKDFAV
jgi:hypothetical protein